MQPQRFRKIALIARLAMSAVHADATVAKIAVTVAKVVVMQHLVKAVAQPQ